MNPDESLKSSESRIDRSLPPLIRGIDRGRDPLLQGIASPLCDRGGDAAPTGFVTS